MLLATLLGTKISGYCVHIGHFLNPCGWNAVPYPPPQSLFQENGVDVDCFRDCEELLVQFIVIYVHPVAVFVGQDGIAALVCKAKDAYVQALAGAHPQV